MAGSKIQDLAVLSVPSSTSVIYLVDPTQGDTDRKVDKDGMRRWIANGDFEIRQTTDDANGAVLDMYVDNGPSPGNSDRIMEIHAYGNNSVGTKTQMAALYADVMTATAGSEDGAIYMNITKDGAISPIFAANAGTGYMDFNMGFGTPVGLTTRFGTTGGGVNSLYINGTTGEVAVGSAGYGVNFSTSGLTWLAASSGGNNRVQISHDSGKSLIQGVTSGNVGDLYLNEAGGGTYVHRAVFPAAPEIRLSATSSFSSVGFTQNGGATPLSFFQQMGTTYGDAERAGSIEIGTYSTYAIDFWANSSFIIRMGSDGALRIGTKVASLADAKTPKLVVANPSNSNQWLAMGYDNTLGSFITSVNHLTAFTALNLQPDGGNVTMIGMPIYTNDAAADADATLPSGALYRTTPGGRTVFRKP